MTSTTIINIDVTTRRKEEMANIIRSIADYIENIGNKKIYIKFSVGVEAV